MTTIADLVEAWQPTDDNERICRRYMLALAARGVGPTLRTHFSPGHFSASCYVVHRASRSLLLHRHRRLGQWLPLGGHLEAGEDPATAALRKAQQESGLLDLHLVTAAALSLDIHRIPATHAEPLHHHYDVAFVAEIQWPSRPTITAQGKFEWMELGEACTRAESRGVQRAIARLARLPVDAVR